MVIFTMEKGRALQGPELHKPLQNINVVTSSAQLSRVTTNSADPGTPKYPTWLNTDKHTFRTGIVASYLHM